MTQTRAPHCASLTPRSALRLGSALPLASALMFASVILLGSTLACSAAALAEPVPAAIAEPAPAPIAEPARAALDDHGQLRDPVLQTRFERITKELRCLVCQNESIADSNVELAADLRRQVREMLVAGRSDDTIFKFMTDRYGEFVRFAPPLTPKTALIWGAPFLMLLLGGFIVYRVVRQRSRMPLDE